MFGQPICRLIILFILESFEQPELLLLLVPIFVLKMQNLCEFLLIDGSTYLVLDDRLPAHLGLHTVEVSLKADDALHLRMLDRVNAHLEGLELVLT